MRARSVLVVGALLALGACGGTTRPAATTGVVTGTVDACAGPEYVPTAHVWVYRGGQLVARKLVPSGSVYEFTLRPGTYVLSNSSLEMGRPASVTAGKRVHLDLPNWCS